MTRLDGACRRIVLFLIFAARVEAQSGLDAAVHEAQAGRLASAFRAAETEPDPLRRIQAKVYVLAKAGDLPGALRCAREGLAMHSDDLWLLERSCSLAVAMHLGSDAQAALGRLAHVLDRVELEPAERERWNATLVAYGSSVAELSRLGADQSRAKQRARSTILIAGAAAISALGWLAFFQQKKPPQRSVDSRGRPSSPGFS